VSARVRAAAAPQGADARSSAFPRQVRIVGGAWKRSKLPVADRPGLRPTPDRVRETLFNWLGQSLDGWRCVDAFAGSGALGFEAASRGALDVVLVERDAVLVASLKAVQQRLGGQNVRVERADALQWLARAAERSVDLVFLDPPFDSNLLARRSPPRRRSSPTAASSMSKRRLRSTPTRPLRSASRRTAKGAPAPCTSTCCASPRRPEPGATLRRIEAAPGVGGRLAAWRSPCPRSE